MTQCWDATPAERPTFALMMDKLSVYTKGEESDGGAESQLLTSAVEVGGAEDYRDASWR